MHIHISAPRGAGKTTVANILRKYIDARVTEGDYVTAHAEDCDFLIEIIGRGNADSWPSARSADFTIENVRTLADLEEAVTWVATVGLLADLPRPL